MRFARNLCMAVCIFALAGMGHLVFGQTTPLSQEHGVSQATGKTQSLTQDKWQFTITPYTWMVGIDATVRQSGLKVDSHVPFSEVLNNLEFAGQVHFEAQKGKWAFFFDPTYMKLSADATSLRYPNQDISVNFEQWLVEFGGAYHFGVWKVDEERSLSVDGLAGGRYWYFHTDVDTGTLVNPSGGTQWIDPIIGARMKADLSKNAVFYLRGDVGGFGVGSNFSWNLQGIFGYKLSERLTAMAGYRALYVDYQSGSGGARYQATIKGPVLGLSYGF